MGKILNYFTLVMLFILAKSIGASSPGSRNIDLRDTTHIYRIWDTYLNDSTYYYEPHNNNNIDVCLSLDSVGFKNDSTFIIYATIMNLTDKKICVINLYHDNYDFEAQILRANFISNNQRREYVKTDSEGRFRLAQHDSFIVKSEQDISYIMPYDKLHLIYKIHDKEIKSYVKSSKYLQIAIDYEYGISSLIPLNNIVFKYLESNYCKLGS